MKNICPYCEAEREVDFIEGVETVDVRGEAIEVPVSYFKCKTCKGEFEDRKSTLDPLEKAYAEYRKRHGMLHPGEIKTFRRRHGLTQAELSKLLGWGPVTLSRYENGALQDDGHEKMLRLAMEPQNLLNLIEESPDAISAGKRDRLMEELRKEEAQSLSLERVCEENLSWYEADEFSGFKKIDLSKLFNVILYFCRNGVLKTKINKLLFYADFAHFKEYAVSITGTRYAHATFGPVPEKYATVLAALIERGSLVSEECVWSPEITGENLIAKEMPDLNLFRDSEIKIVAAINERFEHFSSKRIMELSHDEEGYKKTTPGAFISYKYAKTLNA